MDKQELGRFVAVLESLDSVDGQLSNFKNRASKAANQAAARYKSQGDQVPSWKLMTEALVKLSKAGPSASKAIKEINAIGALAADSKKGGTLTLADAKKQARALLPKIQLVDDIVASILILQHKLSKEIGFDKLDARDVDLSTTIEKYCPFFSKYYVDFKVKLNSLK